MFKLEKSLILKLKPDEKLLANISAIVKVDNHLWLASDEKKSIERLTDQGNDRYSEHQSFKLKDIITLPFTENDDDEIDIEGFDYDGKYLWLVGSHSGKRLKVKDELTDEINIERLRRVIFKGNRYILARIPIINGKLEKSGDIDRESLLAAQLSGNENGNQLIEALKTDEHISPFLSLPSKDNGFDIEGIAVSGSRIFLGLRGPVLRGMAIILEVELESNPSHPSLLNLKVFDSGGKYKKYFLDLKGSGIRDLCIVESDLYILAGPTMSNDGPIQVFYVPGGFGVAKKIAKPDILFPVPHALATNRAEGLARFSSQTEKLSFVIVYDSPNEEKRIESDSIKADLFVEQ